MTSIFATVENTRLYFFVAALVTISQLCAGAARSSDAEVFEIATNYTVKIKASVRYPFIGDSRGTRSGAGFLIDKKKGWLLTNRHVAGIRPERVRIMFKGQSFHDGKVVYVDRLFDLAIVKLDNRHIPDFAENSRLECKTKPPIGQNVGAFGHPFSLSFSATRGIISGTRERGGRSWIQTDAPINSGNSGGPLLDLSTGKVIGINTSSYSKDSSEGISFAIPITHVCRIIDLLKKGKDPSPPYLPIALSNVPDQDEGLLVGYNFVKQRVKWPLERGDQILAVKREQMVPVKDSGELIHGLRGLDSPATLQVRRNGKKILVSVPLVARSSPQRQIGVFVSGMLVAPISLRDDEFENPNNFMVVHHIDRASGAKVAGFRRWDQIVEVAGHAHKTPNSLCYYLKAAETDKKPIKVLVRRFKAQYASFTGFKYLELTPSNVKLVGEAKRDCTSG